MYQVPICRCCLRVRDIASVDYGYCFKCFATLEPIWLCAEAADAKEIAEVLGYPQDKEAA